MNDTCFSPETIEFAGFSDNKTIGKPDIMGEKLWKKLFERDPKFGGVSCGFWGIPGSGKTSICLQICRQIAERYPNEIIYWREPHSLPMQITNLGVPVNIFTDKKSHIKIKELTEDGTIPTNDYKALVFHRPSSLTKMVKPGINVVYFDDRKSWLKLLQRVKSDLRWYSFFLDECEDLFNSRASGVDWYLNEEFCGSIKELRKARVSLYLNSQVDWDVDARVKTKLMLECFLYGSRKDKNNPLYRGVLQDIRLGEGWITYAHSLFGKIRFSPVEPLDKQYIAVPHS